LCVVLLPVYCCVRPVLFLIRFNFELSWIEGGTTANDLVEDWTEIFADYLGPSFDSNPSLASDFWSCFVVNLLDIS
jgi:Zn-dependent M32 family carboxypeptidase